jgi:hypothetical protein
MTIHITGSRSELATSRAQTTIGGSLPADEKFVFCFHGFTSG